MNIVSADSPPVRSQGGGLSPLELAGLAANQAATRAIFRTYRERLAPNTARFQQATLDCSAAYLGSIGVSISGETLATEPSAWRGMSWGLVEGFIRWMLSEGYAIGTVNVRLSSIKHYCQLASQAGVIPPGDLALIRTVTGYNGKEARHIDEYREVKRVGEKKAEPTPLTLDQANALKSHLNTAQGRRDRLLMCILLDHGLRVGEVVVLPADVMDLEERTFTFYRPKVNKTQIHSFTADTYQAATAYLTHDGPAKDGLLRGSRSSGKLTDKAMSKRGIQKRVQFLGERIGVLKLSPHDCRHYWATQACRNGTDIRALQEAGGWSSPLMPLRYAVAARIANDGVLLGNE